MKILTANNQPLILKSIGYKLKQSGFEIFCANNGQEAINIFDAEKIDLAIIDLNMSVKTGFDVIEHIRKIRHSQMPIIVMSGNQEESVVVDAFNLGADDYIEKPVGLNEVLVRVKRLLKQPFDVNPLKITDNVSFQILQKRAVGIVIPCYNEENRLCVDEFIQSVHQNLGYHLCFVNDGSNDNTLEVLNKLRKGREDYISVYNCEKNGGKAEAVRLGVLHLTQNLNLDYIGYLDADLSTDFKDFEELIKTIETSRFKIVSGSRIDRMGANITKESARKVISKSINMIIRMILGMSFQDTQCGAKIMTNDIATNMFNEKFVTRWIFDVEIFLRMKKFYGKEIVHNLICEQPLKRWIHTDGSKLSMRDSVKIVGQLLEIAIHYR